MLVNCKSCHKKFIVPDAAITESGRLVQCGSCGIKWTQYPVTEITKQEIKKPTSIKIKKNNKSKEKKRDVKLYSEEYLLKKHGLNINKSANKLKAREELKKGKRSGFGFYSYMITIIIFFITILGILSLSKDMLILNYPATELYINYLYEAIDIIKITFNELIH